MNAVHYLGVISQATKLYLKFKHNFSIITGKYYK